MNRVVRYLVFGFAVLALLGWTQYRGWSPLRTGETKTTPKSVRDNPGSYRSTYLGSGAGRYPRGK